MGNLVDKFGAQLARMDLGDFFLLCDALDVKLVETSDKKNEIEDHGPARKETREFADVLTDVLRAFDELSRRDKRLLLRELEKNEKGGR